MQNTNIKNGKDASDKVLIGINKIADPVESTMGPRGKNVAIDKGYGAPFVTNDGKSVAENVTDKDKFINMGVEMNKEVGKKTDSAVGDFTSTSMSLHRAMVREGLIKVGLGFNGNFIKKGMQRAVSDIIDNLLTMAKPIETTEEIKQVATNSSENSDWGTIIAETIEKVGKDGIVTVEESTNFGVESEVVEGMEIDKGYVAPFMINNMARREATLKDSLVFICDTELNQDELLQIMIIAKAMKNTEMLIISDGLNNEAKILSFDNKLRGSFNLYAVQAPGFGDQKKELLEDLAIVAGTKVFSKALGAEFTDEYLQKNIQEYLGKYERVIIGKDKTTIVSNNPESREAIKGQVERLKEQADNIDAEFELERLQKRIARLAGGVAVIRVGAATEGELRQIKDKIDDAVSSTKCAIAEGIVAGGGVALLRAAKMAHDNYKYPDENEEFQLGYEIVLNAIEAPIRAIARNAKQDEGVVLNKIKEGKGAFGFNADTLQYGDMIEMGIIEAVKGNRIALYNACSEASTYLTVDYHMETSETEKEQRSETL